MLTHDLDTVRNVVPAVRTLTPAAIARWLHAGWADVKANPLPSLAYGLLFALGGDIIILSALDTPHLVPLAVSGFFLVAPLLAAGLYELSRGRARGERLMFIDSLRVYGRNLQSLALFGLILAFVMSFWERLTAIAFAVFAGDTALALDNNVYAALFSGEQWPLLLAWLVGGAFVAALVYVFSVVSVPMMADRDADTVTAMLTSLRACRANPGVLALWAAVIVGLTLLGFATLLFGLVVLLPVIGHASWHAYRELVE